MTCLWLSGASLPATALAGPVLLEGIAVDDDAKARPAPQWTDAQSATLVVIDGTWRPKDGR